MNYEIEYFLNGNETVDPFENQQTLIVNVLRVSRTKLIPLSRKTKRVDHFLQRFLVHPLGHSNCSLFTNHGIRRVKVYHSYRAVSWWDQLCTPFAPVYLSIFPPRTLEPEPSFIRGITGSRVPWWLFAPIQLSSTRGCRSIDPRQTFYSQIDLATRPYFIPFSRAHSWCSFTKCAETSIRSRWN